MQGIDVQNKRGGKWRVYPLDGCVCGDGRPYMVSYRQGSVNKLLINFTGGGMSWNGETAASPITPAAMLGKKECFYISGISGATMRLIHVGILNAGDARNPFRRWHMFNIPYTTADFHLGDNDYSYRGAKGENKILRHHGAENVRAALALLRKFVPGTPDALVIMGESGGAFGCVAHCPAVNELYPGCENITVYSEAAHINTPLWPEIANNIWKVNPDLSAYIESGDLIYDLFRYARDNMPPHTKFLHSNSVWDGELAGFMNKLNRGRKSVDARGLAEFNNTLRALVKRLKGELRNYSYYLTDYNRHKKSGATPHVFCGAPKLLYAKMEDGVSVADWLQQAVDGKPRDVGGGLLQ